MIIYSNIKEKNITMVNKNGTIDCRVDRAIVVALHYLGEKMTPKKLDFIAHNFLLIITMKKDKTPIFLSCDEIEKKFIKIIILKIIEKNNQLFEKLEKKEIKKSFYLMPLGKNYRWGEGLIALAKELDLEIKSEKTI